jgi:competence protein ComEA
MADASKSTTSTEDGRHVPAAGERNPVDVPSIAEHPSAEGPLLGLTTSDRRVVTVLVCVAVALMVVHWYQLTQSRPPPVEILRRNNQPFQLDVNEATWVEWMQLDRIGETLARRIVSDREQHGPFQSVDDVERVSGIGPRTLEAVRRHLTCRSAEPSEDGPAE